MYNLTEFFQRFKNTLLFILLLVFALFLTVQSHSYQKSKVVSSANFITGGLYTQVSDVNAYFHLKEHNEVLAKENKELREELLNQSISSSSALTDSTLVDTTQYHADFEVHRANVIANRYSKLDNYITIDKGNKDGIEEEVGVLTGNGIIGVVEKTSENYGRVISILNSNLAINAQLKESDHFGTLSWDGNDPNIMDLTEISKTAPLHRGDTIITNGRSLIFPKGIPIGKIDDYDLDNDQNTYRIKVKLFNDMTNIGNVYIIKNLSTREIKSLEIKEDAE